MNGLWNQFSHSLANVRIDFFKREAWSNMHMTRREQEVLHSLLEGKTNKQIARELGISDFTVRDYVSSIFYKHGVNSRGELFAAIMKITKQFATLHS
ncbi:response regulator transcription factor [Pseudomonas sp. HLT2-19-2]